MTRRSEDEYFSFDKLNKQLEDSIEQSKEMTRRSQELLDRQRLHVDDLSDDIEEADGQAA